MADFAKLDIRLYHHDDQNRYRVQLSAQAPRSNADVSPDNDIVVEIDDHALGAKDVPAEYGEALGRCLFGNPTVREFFGQARSIAQHHSVPLRVRLRADGDASMLHNLHWEKLRVPEQEAFLCHDQRILFSRYLGSEDWRDARLRPRDYLRALVVVANPAPTPELPLDPVNVAGELERAREGLKALVESCPELGAVPVKALYRLPASADDLDWKGLPTFDKLVSELGEEYDILYLACHGELAGTEPQLYLETEDGAIDVRTLEEMVEQDGARRAGLLTVLRQLMVLPRLVILASCQSAGAGGQWADVGRPAVAALGPRLAAAGVPAVLAMQGDVTMSTVERFMPEFFKELGRTGQLDAAVAAARRQVSAREDWWAPVLFMRLSDGRIGWYDPGFRRPDGRPDFRKWPALVERIHDGKCTPILGPGLLDCLLGSVHKVARDWAKAHQFPMGQHQRDDLPTVAQYVSVDQDELYPYEQFGKELRRSILEHYKHVFEPELQGAEDKSLEQLIDKVGEWRRRQDPSEPHRVLAMLPFRVYITANPDNLLFSALTDPELEPTRTPHVELCPWKDELVQAPYRDEPSDKNPLVYHLFGRLDKPSSMVLTQDNYIDYLIGVTRNRSLIPPVVQTAMSGRLLLFLGFQIDDWSFRVLLRSIVGRPGSSLLKDYAHVAVQLDPDSERTSDPEAARHYLEQYFGKTAISIYWGRTEDFVRELRNQWNKQYGRERPL